MMSLGTSLRIKTIASPFRPDSGYERAMGDQAEGT
jgi:hypothetical protein